MNKIFSFDAETDGLCGKAFAIGALVYEKGKKIDQFIGRLPDEIVTDKEIRETVLPQMKSIPATHVTHYGMLKAFSVFYLKYYRHADFIVHMSMPIIIGTLKDMLEYKLIGADNGPYPLIDIKGNLNQAGEDPTSVDKFLKKYNLEVGNFEGGTHSPLYDSAAAAVAYQCLIKNSFKRKDKKIETKNG